MLDPQELTDAEINAVSGGQVNNIIILESAAATPTTGGGGFLIRAVMGSTTFSLLAGGSPGQGFTNISVSQTGS